MKKLILLIVSIFLTVSQVSAQSGESLDIGKMLLRLTPASATAKSNIEVAEVIKVGDGKIARPVQNGRGAGSGGGGWDPQIGGKFQLDEMTQAQVQAFVDAHSSASLCRATEMAQMISNVVGKTTKATDIIVSVANAEQAKCVQQAIELVLGN